VSRSDKLIHKALSETWGSSAGGSTSGPSTGSQAPKLSPPGGTAVAKTSITSPKISQVGGPSPAKPPKPAMSRPSLKVNTGSGPSKPAGKFPSVPKPSQPSSHPSPAHANKVGSKSPVSLTKKTEWQGPTHNRASEPATYGSK
jgi:hypothetical protein